MKGGHRLSRRIVALFIVFQVAAQGCVQRQVQPAVPSDARNVYREAAPESLSEVIRSVYRISEENYASQARRTDHSPSFSAGSKASAPESGTLEESSSETHAARVAKARRHLLEGRLPEALEEVELLTLEKSEDPGIQEALARLWRMLGDGERALHHARLAHRMRPHSPETLELLAQLLVEVEKWSEAAGVLEDAAQVTPMHVPTLVRLGLALSRSDRLQEARRILEKALFVQPALPEARENLARIKFLLGEEDQALYDLRALYPEAAARMQLGELYRSQSRWEEARRAFSAALARDPELAVARNRLTEVESYLAPPAIVHLPPFSEAGRASAAARSSLNVAESSLALSSAALPSVVLPLSVGSVTTTFLSIGEPIRPLEALSPRLTSPFQPVHEGPAPTQASAMREEPPSLIVERIEAPPPRPVRPPELRAYWEPTRVALRPLAGSGDLFGLGSLTPRVTWNPSPPLERTADRLEGPVPARESARVAGSTRAAATAGREAAASVEASREAFTSHNYFGIFWIVMLLGLAGIVLGACHAPRSVRKD